MVDTPEEIPALIEHLEVRCRSPYPCCCLTLAWALLALRARWFPAQANPEKAEAMASAGREVVEALGFDTVCRYMFELLTQVCCVTFCA